MCSLFIAERGSKMLYAPIQKCQFCQTILHLTINLAFLEEPLGRFLEECWLDHLPRGPGATVSLVGSGSAGSTLSVQLSISVSERSSSRFFRIVPSTALQTGCLRTLASWKGVGVPNIEFSNCPLQQKIIIIPNNNNNKSTPIAPLPQQCWAQGPLLVHRQHHKSSNLVWFVK